MFTEYAIIVFHNYLWYRSVILVETHPIYWNTQVYFRKKIIDYLHNDDRVWARAYRKWLHSQGATIVPYNGSIPVVRSSLGVAPYYDKFGFRNNGDAVAFVLRWS